MLDHHRWSLLYALLLLILYMKIDFTKTFNPKRYMTKVMTGRRSPAQFVCFSTSQNTFPTGTERDFRPEPINTSTTHQRFSLPHHTNLNREYTRSAIYRLHKFNAFNTGVPPGDFTFDEARHHICGIVPAVSTEFPQF